MGKSQNSENLENIVRMIEPLLSSKDFKLRQSTFNKTCEPGLIQVVSFGMGQSWSMYSGKFTVDIGIYIQEAYLTLHPFIKKLPKIATATHCEIIRRLPSFQPDVDDHWWELDPPFENSIKEISYLLQNYGFPFLDHLRSRTEIIEQWLKIGNKIGLPPRGKLSIAVIQAKLGNINEAARLAWEEYGENEGHPYSKFVQQVMNSMGLDPQ